MKPRLALGRLLLSALLAFASLPIGTPAFARAIRSVRVIPAPAGANSAAAASAVSVKLSPTLSSVGGIPARPSLKSSLVSPALEFPTAAASVVAPNTPAVVETIAEKVELPALKPRGRIAPMADLQGLGEIIVSPKAEAGARTGFLRAAFGAAFDGMRSFGKALGPYGSDGSGVDAEFSGRSPPKSQLAPSQRRLEDIEELRVGTYNVLNLMEHVGKFLNRDGMFQQLSPKVRKADRHIRGVAKAILESDLDIVTVQEVENIAALDFFNERHLGGRYETLLIEGNDGRGIDIGFLVKKDIPFEIEFRTHKDEMWSDPANDGRERKLFSRDLPVLIVRAPGKTEPLFVIFGTHLKSKRDRRGRRDPQSRILRRAQSDRSAEIVQRARAEFGEELPILFAGDFNGDVNLEDVYSGFRENSGLTDAFDLLDEPPPYAERITHTYHPRRGPAVGDQKDAVFASKSMGELLRKVWVYRYQDAAGRPKPIPRTRAERDQNPSDHFPVVMTLSFQPLLKRVAKPAERTLPEGNPQLKAASLGKGSVGGSAFAAFGISLAWFEPWMLIPGLIGLGAFLAAPFVARVIRSEPPGLRTWQRYEEKLGMIHALRRQVEPSPLDSMTPAAPMNGTMRPERAEQLLAELRGEAAEMAEDYPDLRWPRTSAAIRAVARPVQAAARRLFPRFESQGVWSEIGDRVRREVYHLRTLGGKKAEAEYLRRLGAEIVEQIKAKHGAGEIGFHYNLHGGRAEGYVKGGGIRASRGDIQLKHTYTPTESMLANKVYFFRSSKVNLYDVLNEGNPQRLFIPSRMGHIFMMFRLDSGHLKRAFAEGGAKNPTDISIDFDENWLTKAGRGMVGIPYNTFLAPPFELFQKVKKNIGLAGHMTRNEEILATMRMLQAELAGAETVRDFPEPAEPPVRLSGLFTRIGVFFAGSAVMLGGFVMLFTPGPGLAAMFAGLAILAVEFVWARLLLRAVKAQFKNYLGKRKPGKHQP